MRFSRFARVRALFTAMLNSQVLSDDRPSKRPMPAMTAAQVSYATSPGHGVAAQVGAGESDHGCVVTLDERLECAPVPGGYRGGEAASAVERIDAHQVDAEVAQPL